MSDINFITMILIHFVADFGLQTDMQANNKSSSNKWLLYHISVYSLIWLIGSFIISNDWVLSLKFSLVTFIFHFITDWITSRISKPFWKNKDTHNGFIVIGFDQVLHMIQLWYCIKLILL